MKIMPAWLRQLHLSSSEKQFYQRLPCVQHGLLAHVCLLLPLGVTVAAVGFNWRFHGESVELVFAELRLLYPLVTTGMNWVTDYGDNLLYLAYLGVIFNAVRTGNETQQRFCFRTVLGIFAVLIAVDLAKMLFGMPRPGVPLSRLAFSFDDDLESFPSGHTGHIVALALPLAVYFRRAWLYVLMAALITAVGFSRLWLGRHHPVDVAGGMLFGSLVMPLVFHYRPAAKT